MIGGVTKYVTSLLISNKRCSESSLFLRASLFLSQLWDNRCLKVTLTGSNIAVTLIVSIKITVSIVLKKISRKK